MSNAFGTLHKDSGLDLYVVLKDEVQMRDLDAGLQMMNKQILKIKKKLIMDKIKF